MIFSSTNTFFDTIQNLRDKYIKEIIFYSVSNLLFSIKDQKIVEFQREIEKESGGDYWNSWKWDDYVDGIHKQSEDIIKEIPNEVIKNWSDKLWLLLSETFTQKQALSTEDYEKIFDIEGEIEDYVSSNLNQLLSNEL